MKKMESGHQDGPAQTNVIKIILKKPLHVDWTPLAGPLLGVGASTAEAPGSIPGWGTKIMQTTWHGQTINK